MTEPALHRTAFRLTLAFAASVIVLCAGMLFGAPTARSQRDRTAWSQQSSIAAVIDADVPVQGMSSVTHEVVRRVWLRGSMRRCQRNSLAATGAIAPAGYFPDHCAVALRQIVSASTRTHPAARGARLGAAPTRGPPSFG